MLYLNASSLSQSLYIVEERGMTQYWDGWGNQDVLSEQQYVAWQKSTRREMEKEKSIPYQNWMINPHHQSKWSAQYSPLASISITFSLLSKTRNVCTRNFPSSWLRPAWLRKDMEEQSNVFNGVTPVYYVVCPMGTHTVDYCLFTNIHTHTNTPPRTKPHPASGMFWRQPACNSISIRNRSVSFFPLESNS